MITPSVVIKLCVHVFFYLSFVISIQLPGSILKLKLLNDLDISRNSLTSLPAGLMRLRALRRLNVSENQLSELPQDIGELKNLKSLNASHNSLLALPQVCPIVYFWSYPTSPLTSSNSSNSRGIRE